MKWADDRKSIVKVISGFFKLDQIDTLEDLAGCLSMGDSTLELMTLQLIEDKMVVNRYFRLTPQTYQACKRECSALF